MIKAEIEGREGFLILDTGAPSLTLNAHYFKDRKNKYVNTKLVDYNGQWKSVKARKTALQIGTLQWQDERALVMDLQHMKSARAFPILGLAGARLFEQYEMVFDYFRSEILLFKLNGSGDILDPSYSGHQPDLVIPLGLKGHIPYLEITIGKTELKMGIDTGAEIALIHPRYKKELSPFLQFKTNVDILGVNKQRSRGKLWEIREVKCSFLQLSAMKVTFAELEEFNTLTSGIALDGILGTEFLRQFLTAINTQKKELHIWISDKQEALVAGEKKLWSENNTTSANN